MKRAHLIERERGYLSRKIISLTAIITLLLIPSIHGKADKKDKKE